MSQCMTMKGPPVGFGMIKREIMGKITSCYVRLALLHNPEKVCPCHVSSGELHLLATSVCFVEMTSSTRKDSSRSLENALLTRQFSTERKADLQILQKDRVSPRLFNSVSTSQSVNLLKGPQRGVPLKKESTYLAREPSKVVAPSLKATTSLSSTSLSHFGQLRTTSSSLASRQSLLSSSSSLLTGTKKSTQRGLTSSSISLLGFHRPNQPINQPIRTRSLQTTSSITGAKLQKEAKENGDEVDSGAAPLENTRGFSQPEYDLKNGMEETPSDIIKSALMSMEFPLESETSVSPSADVTATKKLLICSVAASLIQAPNFRNVADETRLSLIQICERLALFDPEFILKVSLYARCELNIRTTANFLLAVAANNHVCRPFIKKYFSASIRLPSDWIDVAELYQAFHDKTLMSGSLPVALRKAMVAKFPDFDSYQLAKYNKDKKKKPPPASSKKKAVKSENEESGAEMAGEDGQQPSEEELVRLTFTLKQLIRKLHITNPVLHVMSLIGKHYPDDLESFYKSKLPGTWDPEMAGKRMKLPVPETWETQVSSKGNRASTWESLIDHHKLPFMAMLRNLRNLILSNVSSKHHGIVLKKLTDKGAVANSRQFPFRFFSAYEVLGQLEKLVIYGVPAPTFSSAPMDGKARAAKARAKKLAARAENVDLDLIERYRRALDSAVKIATLHNVKPIAGQTLIFCNVGSDMDKPCTSARGLGKPRTVLEVGLLLGLMCKYCCEESELRVYGGGGHSAIGLKEGTVLENMDFVLSTVEEKGMSTGVGEFPCKVLNDILQNQIPVDNILILDNAVGNTSSTAGFVTDFLEKYRRLVNPDLLFVNVDLSGPKCQITPQNESRHENDIFVAGYSDQILRFIAERGSGMQMIHVENIDVAYKLKEVKVPALMKSITLPALGASNAQQSLRPRWRTARVFISSTFKDMHGERDLLTRYVFPELRARARQHFINVFEVDLRWGVTESEMKSKKGIEVCLSEVGRCDFFIGILGERYGWIPEAYNVPDEPEFDWVREYSQGRSITELEIYHAALADASLCQEKAFFYFRDSEFLNSVPNDVRNQFEADSGESALKMKDLKTRIATSGLEVFDNYPCKWGGILDGKPMVQGLDEFANRILNNLWNAIHKQFPDEEIGQDELTEESQLHTAFVELQSKSFTGRKTILKQAQSTLIKMESGVVAFVGKPGCGKTSLMSAFLQEYGSSSACSSFQLLLAHFVGVAPGSTNIANALRRICHELKCRFDVTDPVPEEYQELTVVFPEILTKAANAVGPANRIVVFVDALDRLDSAHHAKTLEWMPDPLPKGVVFVVSVLEGGQCLASLQRMHQDTHFVSVGGLDMWDKAEMVRCLLKEHRKTLEESPFNNQLKLLLSKRDASVPLFLTLACEELRVFGVFEKVSEKIKKMSSSLTGLLQEILVRLETDHGEKMVSTSLLLIVCSRNGLTEMEMMNLLSLYFGEFDFKKSPLDHSLSHQCTSTVGHANFARLVRSLQCFLQSTAGSRDGLLVLAHADVASAVKRRYFRLSSSDQEKNFHRLLAAYFYKEADPLGNGSYSGLNKRACSELAYHLTCAGAWKELEQVVCNLRYIQAKCQLGLGLQLGEDFQAEASLSTSAEKERAKFLERSNVQDFGSFVSRNIHIISSYSSLVIQQAVNEPDTSLVCQAAKELSGREPVDEGGDVLLLWANKPEKSHPCQMTITGYSKPVLCLATSPDGHLVACGCQDCTVKVYEIKTGKEVKTFVGHAHAVVSCCFAGSSRLCSASLDGSLSLWDVNDGHRISTMATHKRRIGACSSDPAGRFVVSVGWDSRVIVWSSKDGSLVAELREESRPVNCVDFHPDGQLIATGSWDSNVRIWDTFNKRRVKILRGHGTSVRSVAYSPSGTYIASASLDGEVKLWSSTAGSQVGSVRGHCLAVSSLCFTSFDNHLVTGGDDRLVKVWSAFLGKPIFTINTSSSDKGNITALAVNPVAQLLAAGFHEKAISIYNAFTGAEHFHLKDVHEASVRCLQWNTDDNKLVSGSDDGTLKVFSVSSTESKAVSTLIGHEKGVWCVCWHESTIASGSEDFTVNLYDMSTAKQPKKGKKKQPPKDSSSSLISPTLSLVGHTAPVTAVCLTADGKQVLSASRDKSVVMWDSSTGSVLHTLPDAHNDWINDLALADNGHYFVTASNDFTLKLWNIKTLKQKRHLKGHIGSVTGVAIKSGCIVSSSVDGTCKVWSHKGVEITTLHGHKQRVNACCIYMKDSISKDSGPTNWAEAAADLTDMEFQEAEKSVDGVAVASASDDGSIKMWMALQANEVTSLAGHSDRVVSVRAIDKEIVTSSLDKTVKLWKPEIGDGLSCVRGHNAPVTCSVFSACGSWALSSSRDGSVIVWKMKATSSSFLPEHHSMVIPSSDESVNAVCFLESSSEHADFVLARNSGVLSLWSFDATPKRQPKRKFSTSHGKSGLPVTSLAYGRQKKVLVSGSWDKTIGVWKVSQGSLQLLRVLKGPADWILSLSFSEDEKLIVSTVANSGVFLWDAETSPRKLTLESDGSESGEEKRWALVAQAVESRGGLLEELDGASSIVLVGDSSGCVSAFHQGNGTELASQKLHRKGITGGGMGRSAYYSGSADGTVKVWSGPSLQQIGLFFMQAPVTCLSVALVDDVDRIVVGDALGNVTFLQSST